MDRQEFIEIFPQFSAITPVQWSYYSALVGLFLRPLLPADIPLEIYQLISFQLMAHLLALKDRGGNAGAVTSASDDIASIGYTVPGINGNKGWWWLTSFGVNAYQFIKRYQSPVLVKGDNRDVVVG